ncbi:hypothetical protein KCU83_g446, partial [Aureobasidium melanogenum]
MLPVHLSLAPSTPSISSRVSQSCYRHLSFVTYSDVDVINQKGMTESEHLLPYCTGQTIKRPAGVQLAG